MNETELRSKSDQEINELAAIVMGWSVAKHQNGRIEAQSYPAIFPTTKESFIVRSQFGMDEGWNPAKNANQALMVAEKVRRLDRWSWVAIENPYAGVDCPDSDYVCCFYLGDAKRLKVKDPSFAKALTLAALLANDSLKGEVGE